MKKLPNGIVIFNSTPHPVTFWKPGWEGVVIVEPDERIDAEPTEELASRFFGIKLVKTVFKPTSEGLGTINLATSAGADVIIGSIIAAQAYPGKVCAMVPAPGYERVPPSEKRMLPDKFTVF